MDSLTLLGLAIAGVAILGGNYLEGGHLSALLNSPAALIVFGGTLGAALLQTPKHTFIAACKMVPWVLVPPRLPIQDGIDKVVQWGFVARREGLLGLEQTADEEPDRFSSKALQLLVDGSEADKIRNIMELELFAQERKELEAAKVFESMGGYAPTIGILGAVLGLIHVMANLEDPEALGAGIATAFVATVYGVGSANLLLLPLANKLKSIVMQRYHYREMVVEGILAIAEGENPYAIETKLQGYL